jgi:ribosomal protein L11
MPGSFNPFLSPFKKTNTGIAKLINKKILQSIGICKKLNKTSKKEKTPNPIPTLIKFLSKRLFEFLIKKVILKPSPQMYIKNKSIVIMLITKRKINEVI